MKPKERLKMLNRDVEDSKENPKQVYGAKNGISDMGNTAYRIYNKFNNVGESISEHEYLTIEIIQN
jgi:hypothetical protein